MTRAELESLTQETRAILAIHRCPSGAASCPMCLGFRDVLKGIEILLPPPDHGTVEPPAREVAERLRVAENGSLF